MVDRERAGREASRSAAATDSQSVKAPKPQQGVTTPARRLSAASATSQSMPTGER
jgi:hypothetical protein